MNRVYTTLVILLILVGCAPDPFDYSFNRHTDGGIRVRIEPGAVALSLADIDSYYQDVSQCVLGETPEPFFLVVISATDVTDENGAVSDGIIDYAPRMPIITFRNVDGGDVFALAVFRHELIHALLWVQGKSTAHSMPEFERCDYL